MPKRLFCLMIPPQKLENTIRAELRVILLLSTSQPAKS